MNNSSLKPSIKRRTNRFFGQYDHCLRAFQPEFHCLRQLDHANIDRIVRMRQDWGRTLVRSPQPGHWYWSALDISEQDVADLHSMCDFLLAERRPYKLNISGGWFYLYTNATSLIDDVSQLPWLDQSRMCWTQVELVGRPDVIVRRQARHSRRTFFRGMRIDQTQRQNLVNLLDNNKEIRPSPALSEFLQGGRNTWTRVQDYFFVDHDDDAWLLFLSLAIPGIVRKTLSIEQHK